LNTTDTTPWYRQFWPWFLISLPATAVIACTYTIYLAVLHKPNMINDNYYQEGLSVNDRIKQDQRATSLSMQANLSFSQQTGKVNVYLTGNNKPLDSLSLTVSAVGDKLLDRTYTLKPINTNLFSIAQPELPDGRYYLTLEPEHREWRLLSEITLPRDETLVLTNNIASRGVKPSSSNE